MMRRPLLGSRRGTWRRSVRRRRRLSLAISILRRFQQFRLVRKRRRKKWQVRLALSTDLSPAVSSSSSASGLRAVSVRAPVQRDSCRSSPVLLPSTFLLDSFDASEWTTVLRRRRVAAASSSPVRLLPPCRSSASGSNAGQRSSGNSGRNVLGLVLSPCGHAGDCVDSCDLSGVIPTLSCMWFLRVRWRIMVVVGTAEAVVVSPVFWPAGMVSSEVVTPAATKAISMRLASWSCWRLL